MKRRLPTEAEFARAAGGTDGRAYPWGDTLDCDHASYLGCTTDTTDVETPLAGASPVGAPNMAGNVWEWVSDWYSEDYHAESPAEDPTAPQEGEYKVRRGGGYSSLERQLVVSAREREPRPLLRRADGLSLRDRHGPSVTSSTSSDARHRAFAR